MADDCAALKRDAPLPEYFKDTQEWTTMFRTALLTALIIGLVFGLIENLSLLEAYHRWFGGFPHLPFVPLFIVFIDTLYLFILGMILALLFGIVYRAGSHFTTAADAETGTWRRRGAAVFCFTFTFIAFFIWTKFFLRAPIADLYRWISRDPLTENALAAFVGLVCGALAFWIAREFGIRRSVVHRRIATVIYGYGAGLAGLFIIFLVVEMTYRERIPSHAQIPDNIRTQQTDGGSFTRDDMNILLVTLDTTRPDHLECYRYDETRTPTLNGLAERGVLFENAYCQSPITLPSHSTILTSRYPPFHGVRNNHEYVLDQGNRTLAEIFRERGYYTAAFLSAFVLDATTGIQQGFDLYEDYIRVNPLYMIMVKIRTRLSAWYVLSRIPGLKIPMEYRLEREAGKTTDLALTFIDRIEETPFFLWIHYFDPHEPYTFREGFTGLAEQGGDSDMPEEDRGMIPDDEYGTREERIRLYDGEISCMDFHMGRLIDGLHEKGVLDRTLIVAVGDHGQHHGEHDYFNHANKIYKPSTAVPLIFAFPSGSPRGIRIEAPVSTVDIAPSILAIAGIPAPSSIQGNSLFPLPEDDVIPGRAIYCETVPSSSGTPPSYRGILYDEWECIFTFDGVPMELYNLRRDPGEKLNVLEGNPELVAALQESLQVILDMDRELEIDPTLRLDAERRAKLQALGYVQ
jgi:arylsulfatase A-like enzyme